MSEKNKSNDSIWYLSKESVGMPLHQPPVHKIKSNVIDFQWNLEIHCTEVMKEPAQII